MRFTILVLVTVFFSCKQQELKSDKSDFVYIDTLNIDYCLGFKDFRLFKGDTLYQNLYITSAVEDLKIRTEKEFLFDRNSLQLSNNKHFFSITGFETDRFKNIKDTIYFLIKIEEAKIVHEQQDIHKGMWRGNLWYYIKDEIYFDNEYYQNSLKSVKIDYPISLTDINFVKVENFQSDKTKNIIKIGYKDSTNFEFRDSDEHINLFHQPYIIKGNSCYKIKGFDKNSGGTILTTSPNQRFLLMETLNIGYVETSDKSILYDKTFCVIVDSETNNVILKMDSACGGEWDINNNWINAETHIINPANK